MSGTEYVAADIPAALRSFVSEIVGYREEFWLPVRRCEFSGTAIVVILGWDAPLRIRDPRSSHTRDTAAFIAGLHDSYVVTESVGRGEAVEMMLTPMGARRLLGGALPQLANEVATLEELDDGWLSGLTVRMSETDDWARCFQVLRAGLYSRLNDTGAPDGVVWRAWNVLRGRQGDIRVDALARELGVSRRHLGARFKQELGLPPKTVARLLRFERAFRLRERAATEGWSRVAAECGFADQAHLTAECHSLAGTTPAKLAVAADWPVTASSHFSKPQA